jgi:hypothetical protein
MGNPNRTSLFLLMLFVSAHASANCGSGFCSINTNSEIQEGPSATGLSLNVRYEYVDLDQPREGTNKVGARGEPGEHDELETTNSNVVLSLDYMFDQHWGIGIQLPYLNRKHAHIHNPDEDGIANGEEPEREEWKFSGIGDARAVGRYRFNFGNTSLGLHAGLKFPTGSTDGKNDAGEEAERTLQLGTGSTDLIAGLFAKGAIGETPMRWFAQTQFQHAVATKNEFRPGDEITLDIGVRYLVTDNLTANLQVNTRYKRRDGGANAEPAESGGKFAYISPGISYAFAGGFQIYGYVQVPLYQNVNGVQLTQSTSYVAGVGYRF